MIGTLVPGVSGGSCQARLLPNPRPMPDARRGLLPLCDGEVDREAATRYQSIVAVFEARLRRRAAEELLGLGYVVHWISLPGDAPQALPAHPGLTYLTDAADARVGARAGFRSPGRDGRHETRRRRRWWWPPATPASTPSRPRGSPRPRGCALALRARLTPRASGGGGAPQLRVLVVLTWRRPRATR